ncbi:hypothetical protein [Rhizobium rhizogenes]|jgi:hypothetical protein|uniref:hypothetical protein n=1 Tax=Rhizobium rhizogenes TaxID=359 RepID=UPI0013969CB8|nr:hypothetical protein [Rhizobium rhizogenes]NTI80424.1 hypothetical protein [Rhizobium rhizogenes]NTJ22610.1 hypothetical protein [Rhizobium rhizogenes]QUE82339.1 hypothetical protein EML492_05770 [Rhizobium rhizogenes]
MAFDDALKCHDGPRLSNGWRYVRRNDRYTEFTEQGTGAFRHIPAAPSIACFFAVNHNRSSISKMRSLFCITARFSNRLIFDRRRFIVFDTRRQ